MANPFSRFLHDRVIAPVQAERAPTVERAAFAIGAGATRVETLAQPIGQAPDVNFQLLYAIALLKAENQGILCVDEVRERYFALPKETPEQRAEGEKARQAKVAQMQPKEDTSTPAAAGEADAEYGSEAEDAPTNKAVSKALTPSEIEAIRNRRGQPWRARSSDYAGHCGLLHPTRVALPGQARHDHQELPAALAGGCGQGRAG